MRHRLLAIQSVCAASAHTFVRVSAYIWQDFPATLAFLALCLAIIASATMLHGRVLRDLVGRRIIITACLGIFVQILYVAARSATVSSPFVWPLMYLSIFIPCGIGILVLMRPLLITGLLSRLSSSPRVPHQKGQM